MRRALLAGLLAAALLGAALLAVSAAAYPGYGATAGENGYNGDVQGMGAHHGEGMHGDADMGTHHGDEDMGTHHESMHGDEDVGRHHEGMHGGRR